MFSINHIFTIHDNRSNYKNRLKLMLNFEKCLSIQSAKYSFSYLHTMAIVNEDYSPQFIDGTLYTCFIKKSENTQNEY